MIDIDKSTSKLLAKKYGGSFADNYFQDHGIQTEDDAKALQSLSKKRSSRVKDSCIKEISSYILETAPGLVGEIARWITKTAYRPQPSLSLGVALTAVGVLKGHKVQSEYGSRTNLFCLGLADSGAGKSHPMEMIDLLFEQSGNGKLLCGVPASDSAVVRMLHDRGGKALLLWDEIGYSLKDITDERSSSHQKMILKALLEVSTKAKSTYRGKEKASHTVEARMEVKQPCLGLWGTTTIEKFYEALKQGNAVDGFLPRWLTFIVTDPDRENDLASYVEDVPDEILEKVAKLNALATNDRPQGNIDSALEIRPRTIPFSDEARKFLSPIKSYYNEKLKAERERGTGLQAMWTRGFDLTIRVALTVDEGEEISDTSLIWAHSLVSESLELSCQMFISNSHENEFARRRGEYLGFIASKGSVTTTDLAYKFKGDNARLRKEYLQALVDSNEIIAVEEKTLGRPMTKYVLSSSAS